MFHNPMKLLQAAHSLTTIPFEQGPKIAITLEFEHHQLVRSSLSFSKSFECHISGEGDPSQIEKCIAFLEDYSKKIPGAMQLPLENQSPFRKKVLSHLAEIPFGSILTYGELASLALSPKAARAVGSACHYNPFPLFIPCHRVIASGGRPGGFAYDLKMKLLLLDFEKHPEEPDFGRETPLSKRSLPQA